MTTMKNRKPKKSRQVLRIFVLVFLVALVATGFFGYTYVTNALKPVSDKSEVVTMEIAKGSSTDTAMQALYDAKLIHDVTIAKYYARYVKLTSIKAGIYKLDKSWTLKAILEKINDPKGAVSTDVLLTIVPGDWARDIAKKISAKTGLDETQLLALWNDDAYIDELSKTYSVITADGKKAGTRVKLEGYLFPETYFIKADWSMKKVTEKLIAQTQSIYDKHKAEFAATKAAHNFTTHQVIILSSVVQFEASKPADMKNIAQVFYNRLKLKMLLQSSVTVCYALYDYTDWRACETNSSIDSRYNTYKYPGLPIGPVTNPSESAINAVLNPTPNDYLYFIADVYGDGTVYYAKTYAQHQANIQKYLK
ncbi:MAG: endolytic transglycosylase MltG [Erysipelotrichaceae bacterium]